MSTQLEALDNDQLVTATGGLPPGAIPRFERQEPPRDMKDQLNRRLRGGDDAIEVRPKQPDVDRRIQRDWDPFASPRRDADT
jgi:hypothetical protein